MTGIHELDIPIGLIELGRVGLNLDRLRVPLAARSLETIPSFT